MNREELRRRAELAVADDTSADNTELRRLVHELRVHELELEMQNDELRSTQVELEDARDQYFELFDLAPVAYVTITPDSTIVDANVAAAQLFDCDRGQLLHSALSAFVHARDVELFWLYLRELFGSKQQHGLEMRLGHGKVIPVRFEGSALPASEREPARARLAVLDLSELRSANERSRLHLLRYKQLVETLPVGVIIIDRDWRILDANDAAAHALRLPATELRDTHLRAVMPANASPRWFVALSRVMHGGEPVAETGAHTFADGLTRWYELRVFPVAEGVCALVSDISARHGALQALADSEAQYRAVVTAARDAIITVDLRGNIESCNPAAERMFGFAGAELLGEPITRLVPPQLEQMPGADGIVGELTSDTTLTGDGRELLGRQASGATFPIHAAITRVEVAGEPKFVTYIRDLRESKQLERELRQAQKMEAIGTLASGVAHDFNNLLMGVSGCASIALEHLDASNPARMYVAEIKKSVDSGAAITRQLLTFSRKRDDQPAVFELNRLIAGQQAMLQRLLGEDIELCIEPRATDSRVCFAPGHLEQVLMNLAINARDAMPSGGRLVISTRDAEQGEQFVLSVADTGIGMTPEQAERVFEPFFTTKDEGEGTGLGLSTVYGLVTHAGGTISVTSEPGRGTRFDVVLPRATVPITREFELAPSIQEKQDGTILLVEDDRTVRMAVKHYLEGAGYRVLEAGTGAEAIECANKFAGPIDLLLSDVQLPRGSGPQVAAAVCRRKPEMAVLFISAHSAETLHNRGDLGPGAHLIQKPFKRAALLARIREVLEPME